MNTKFLSLLAGAAVLGFSSFATAPADAAEPMQLTAVQMDSVTAGSRDKGKKYGHHKAKKVFNIVKQDAYAVADSSVIVDGNCNGCKISTGDATAVAVNANVQ